MQKEILIKKLKIYFTKSLILSVFLFNFSCGQTDSHKTDSNTNKAIKVSDRYDGLMIKGKEVAQHLNLTLKGELIKAIEAHGVEGAVEFCSIKAIPLTDSISTIENVEINRVSHKPRNPKNAANDNEILIIEQYLEEKNEKTISRPVIISDNEIRTFYAPIHISTPLCLSCHGKVGSDISNNLYSSILSKYPSDKAIGFEMNELRGLLKVSGYVE